MGRHTEPPISIPAPDPSYEQRRRLLTDQVAQLGPTEPRNERSNTVTRPLTATQAQQIRPRLDNVRRLRELTTQLRALALEQATKRFEQAREPTTPPGAAS